MRAALCRRKAHTPGRSVSATALGKPVLASARPATPVPAPSSSTVKHSSDGRTGSFEPVSDSPRSVDRVDAIASSSSSFRGGTSAAVVRRRHTSGWETYAPRSTPASHTVNPVAGMGSSASSLTAGEEEDAGPASRELEPAPRRSEGAAGRRHPTRFSAAVADGACAMRRGGAPSSAPGTENTKSSSNFER